MAARSFKARCGVTLALLGLLALARGAPLPPRPNAGGLLRGGQGQRARDDAAPPSPAGSRSRGQIVATRRGFYPQVYEALDAPPRGENENCSTFCVQQVQGAGDCLFHSIAISMALEDEECHLDMYDPSLEKRVSALRELAVKTLTEDPNRTLHLEGDQAIVTSELVDAAAEQYGMTPESYCESMRRAGVWGGGPEILALVNALERPIHVFEPVPACNGTEFRLQLCGAFGSPRFDSCGTPVCIIAADDRFPNCKPTEVKRHGEGGNHFLALLPASALEGAAVS